MTTSGKRWFPLGAVALLSVLTGTACGSTTAGGKGADNPGDPGQTEENGGLGEAGSEGEGASSTTSSGEEAAAPESDLPKEGVQGEENRSMKAKMSLTLSDSSGAAAGLLDKGWSLAEGRRVMVEKVGSTAVTKYSVLFGERKTSGLESWSKLPTEGKGYSVVHKDGALTILDNGKTEATPGEREVVEAEYGFIGKSNPLKLAIQKAEAGDKQKLDTAAHAFLLGHVPEIQVESVTISHTGKTKVGGRDAHQLAVTANGKIPDGEITYSFAITGPATVDAQTGWPTELNLQGKLEVSGRVTVKKKDLAATGKGELAMTRTAKIK